MRRVVAVFFLCVSMAAQESRPTRPNPSPLLERETAELFPEGETVDDQGRETHFVTRVLDAQTRAPIAGATFSVLAEARRRLPGPWTPVRTAASDADGWVRLRVDDIHGKWSWCVCEASGYGPMMEMRWMRPVKLHRGVDVPIEVRIRSGVPRRAPAWVSCSVAATRRTSAS